MLTKRLLRAAGALPGRRMLTIDALQKGRAIVWGRGPLGMRPPEGMSLGNLSMAPSSPVALNTLTDKRIEKVRAGGRLQARRARP